VVKSLKQKVDECLQVNVTMKRTEGGMTTMNTTDEYRTKVVAIDKNHAELTTQYAVDIERLTPSTTKLTYYGG
jgi:hypothetical protein